MARTHTTGGAAVAALRVARAGRGRDAQVVRGLVEQHGGAVRAHSEGPGKGSEFVVRLPALSS